MLIQRFQIYNTLRGLLLYQLSLRMLLSYRFCLVQTNTIGEKFFYANLSFRASPIQIVKA